MNIVNFTYHAGAHFFSQTAQTLSTGCQSGFRLLESRIRSTALPLIQRDYAVPLLGAAGVMLYAAADEIPEFAFLGLASLWGAATITKTVQLGVPVVERVVDRFFDPLSSIRQNLKVDRLSMPPSPQDLERYILKSIETFKDKPWFSEWASHTFNVRIRLDEDERDIPFLTEEFIKTTLVPYFVKDLSGGVCTGVSEVSSRFVMQDKNLKKSPENWKLFLHENIQEIINKQMENNIYFEIKKIIDTKKLDYIDGQLLKGYQKQLARHRNMPTLNKAKINFSSKRDFITSLSKTLSQSSSWADIELGDPKKKELAGHVFKIDLVENQFCDPFSNRLGIFKYSSQAEMIEKLWEYFNVVYRPIYEEVFVLTPQITQRFSMVAK